MQIFFSVFFSVEKKRHVWKIGIMQEEIDSKIFRAFERLFLHSWWVLLFVLLCFFFYEQGERSQKSLYLGLTTQLEELTTEKMKALERQKRLRMQINSQSDPAWIELTLRRCLGVVPEGESKIYFTETP